MAKNKISLKTARKLAIHSQLMDNKARLPEGKEGIAQTIENLGYIQIDTIAVIERAHHHTLWTRCPDYNHQMLHDLQAQDRRIFEYWGHAASYLPMSDYRFYQWRMKRFIESPSSWVLNWREKHEHMMKPVRERIQKEGALSSKDFETKSGEKRGSWWDWRPVKIALEMLFWQGELMITERRNFQKVYDLTERVIPGGVNTSYPSNDEVGRFLVNRALKSYGVATEKEIVDHLDIAERAIISNSLKDMVSAGEVVSVSIDGTGNSSYYALPDMLEGTSEKKIKRSRVYLLSPFDNLIILRDRIKKLFGYEYALECYTPPAKRIHGYFVLPILYGDNFTGRLDPKADRKMKTLIIRKLMFEEEYKPDNNFLTQLTKSLIDFMKFNNCEKIKLVKVVPSKYKASLNKLIKQYL